VAPTVPETTTTTVLAADAQPLFLDAVARTIRQDSGLRLVGERDDGAAALAGLRRLSPDVALIDTGLPTLDGRRILAAARRDELATRIVLLACVVEAGAAYEAIRDGAAGILCKRASADQLRAAIRRAAAGEVVLCDDAQSGIAGEIRRRDPLDRPLLSARERQVLGLVAEGRSAPDIGRRLHLSVHTVRSNIERLYEKLDAGERAQMVAIAMRRGLLE
jgi:two-component system nitrate/nitrite response regulator NarL